MGYVLDLQQKVQGLVARLYEIGVINKNSIPVFCKYFCDEYDFKYESIKRNWAEDKVEHLYDDGARYWRISDNLQEKFGKIGRFDYRVPPWGRKGVPPDTPYSNRPDNHIAFKKYLEQFLTEDNFNEVETSVPCLVVEPKPPRNCNAYFASISLDGGAQDTPAGKNLQLFMENRFHTENLGPEGEIGLPMVRLQLKFSNPNMRVYKPVDGGSDAEFSRNNVKTVFAGGPWEPFWVFSMKEGFLTKLVTMETPLCELENAGIDDTVTGILETDLWEIKVRRSSGQVNEQDDLMRARLIEILDQRDANLEPNANGWIEVGTQELTIRKKNSGNGE